MRLTEIIQVRKSKEYSNLCHLAKSLYNLANWYVRQDFFNLNSILSYYDLDFILKTQGAYRNLPSQTSQQILKLVNRNWKSFLRGLKEYREDFTKFRKKPKIPRYKNKNGESIVIFTNQQCKIKAGYLYFPRKVNLKPIKTRITDTLKEVRIVPLGIAYKVELTYEKEENNLGLDKDHILSIDLGLNNLITAVNNHGSNPFIIKGGPIKSINQYYNKQFAFYKSKAKKLNNQESTKRTLRLALKRNNKIKHIFHKVSRIIVNYCIENNIGTILIGKNNGWKQKINLGRKNNQNFVQVPFEQLLQQIKYKSEMVGIQFKTIDESYTSKCSFLDKEPIKKHKNYLGTRISRGLFKSSEGTLINADVNGAYNILKKEFPKSFEDGIEGLGLIPQVLQISESNFAIT